MTVDADWFGRHGTREAEGWFAAQVRGTAPEPPPDGFMVPPGFVEQVRAAIIELFDIPAAMLEPAPPLPWRTRLRWKWADWREKAAYRAFKIIAGYEVPEGDW